MTESDFDREARLDNEERREARRRVDEDEIRNIRDRLHTISTDIAAIRMVNATIDSKLAAINGTVRDHEMRLRVIETLEQQQMGRETYRKWLVAVVIVGLGGLVFQGIALLVVLNGQ